MFSASLQSLEGHRSRQAPKRTWAVASRALARTGDAAAVRHFSRSRILEKNPGKRKLAAQLYEEAAKRHAELKRQAG